MPVKKSAAPPAPRRASKPAAKSAGTKTKVPAKPAEHTEPARPYHHGNLRDALLQAAETVLQRDGLPGLTLRAIARETGVSHTAPKHHFGDTAGLLSDLAASGHWRLGMEIAAQARLLPSGRARRRAVAQGYVHFAAREPELFRLMGRIELLDPARPTLAQGMRASARALMGIFDEPLGEQANPYAGISTDQAVTITAAWGFVHGLSMLLVDQQLGRIAQSAGFRQPVELVEAVLNRMELAVTDGMREVRA